MNKAIKKLRLWWSFYKLNKATKRLAFERKGRIFIQKNEKVNILNYWYYRYIKKFT